MTTKFKKKTFHYFVELVKSNPMMYIVQELAIKKRHQAYRIAAIVHIARLKPKS